MILQGNHATAFELTNILCGLYNEFVVNQKEQERQWSSDSSVLNTAVVIYLKLSDAINSITIDEDCFVAYCLLAACI